MLATRAQSRVQLDLNGAQPFFKRRQSQGDSGKEYRSIGIIKAADIRLPAPLRNLLVGYPLSNGRPQFW